MQPKRYSNPHHEASLHQKIQNEITMSAYYDDKSYLTEKQLCDKLGVSLAELQPEITGSVIRTDKGITLDRIVSEKFSGYYLNLKFKIDPKTK